MKITAKISAINFTDFFLKVRNPLKGRTKQYKIFKQLLHCKRFPLNTDDDFTVGESVFITGEVGSFLGGFRLENISITKKEPSSSNKSN